LTVSSLFVVNIHDLLFLVSFGSFRFHLSAIWILLVLGLLFLILRSPSCSIRTVCFAIQVISPRFFCMASLCSSLPEHINFGMSGARWTIVFPQEHWVKTLPIYVP
jgi:hypothetical protein